jgi:hypothetical protein
MIVKLAVTSLSVYPNHLAYFNLAVGGPENGPKYLLDSNLDWGQDLLKLRRWADRSGGEEPQLLAYFGSADPDYYGFPCAQTPELECSNTIGKRSGLVAISAQCLFGSEPGRYAWLKEREPVAKVGYSIFVYDLGDGAGPKLAGN